jgi:hypothetical protein
MTVQYKKKEKAFLTSLLLGKYKYILASRKVQKIV